MQQLQKIDVPLAFYLPAAIRQAVEDLSAVEASGDHVVDMLSFHGNPHGGTCRVCLAGAALARRTNIPRSADPVGLHLPVPILKLLVALDNVRLGRVHAAVEYAAGLSVVECVKAQHEVWPPSPTGHVTMVPYSNPQNWTDSNRVWKQTVLGIADRLDAWLRRNAEAYVDSVVGQFVPYFIAKAGSRAQRC